MGKPYFYTFIALLTYSLFPTYANFIKSYIMTPKQLHKIRKALPKGYRQILSKKTGFSLKTIDAVLAGKRFNQSVVNMAIDLLEEQFISQQKTIQRAELVLTKIDRK
jgi:hypothetical protein